ncbi:ABC transporter substrate-binding protein [Paenibacillus peoriae]|uniref:ABC transporter substrate-binding protein n=1 Tax=Paenibacillus peoriae TaxID=59893 RepID=UPI00026C5E1D|nr:ABC transporter substrate-binding protein [Paenibacillus peoriae]MEC0182846.1 ABC transporter substrate-binding protein [Paenibacillus peoriae]
MKNIKKVLILLLIVTMSSTLLAACGAKSTESVPNATESIPTNAASTSTEREVTDLAGNTIKVPNEIKSVSITSWKGALEIFTLLGHEDLVASMADTSRYIWLRRIYPNLATVPDFGSFNDVNVEELMKANPDIIFSAENASAANKKMQSLGLPLYVDGVTSKGDPYEGRDAQLKAIADLVGEKEKAQAYLAWEKKWLDEVAKRVKDIPQSERKKVLVLRNSTTEVFNEMNILGLAVSMAGGINVAKDAFSDRFYNEVSAEEIVGWNPDYVFQFQVGSAGEQLTTRFDEMKNDTRFKGMSVLDSGNFYIMPTGLSPWGGKMETALGVLTMAKTMYPDKFSDINISEVAQDFYSTFLNHKLDDEDWKLLLYTANGANKLPINE